MGVGQEQRIGGVKRQRPSSTDHPESAAAQSSDAASNAISPAAVDTTTSVECAVTIKAAFVGQHHAIDGSSKEDGPSKKEVALAGLFVGHFHLRPGEFRHGEEAASDLEDVLPSLPAVSLYQERDRLQRQSQYGRFRRVD